MKHVVIGTAGHVDHGKTMLVKALTGKDTDRLKEEKERGISIELGFAPLTLPKGQKTAIIDVPGHEKFIKNMLAGVGGIDLVLFVIAADEGVMPQTKEHLDIIKLLNIEKGIVVISKMDLVDEDWLDLVREEIKEVLINTPLEHAPMVNVSAAKGIGIKELLTLIEEIVTDTKKQNSFGKSRMPIDRVFSITGFGTVVTGTLTAGKFEVGNLLEIMPEGKQVKVRTIQVHGQKVDEALTGQRVAVNLSGIEVQEINRGSVLCEPNTLKATYRLDCLLELLPDRDKPLSDRTRVRIHHGTKEALGRVLLLDREELEPGEEAFVQLLLEEPLVAGKKDKFVIRSYSPMITIGGGLVIDPNPKRHKRFSNEVISSLATKLEGSPEELILQFISQQQGLVAPEEIKKQLGFNQEELEISCHSLIEENQIKIIETENKAFYLLQEIYLDHCKKVKNVLEDFHKKYPLRSGINKEEIRSRYFSFLNNKQFNYLLQTMATDNVLKVSEKNISNQDFVPLPRGNQIKTLHSIENFFRNSQFQPPSWEEIKSKFNLNEKDSEEFLEYLLEGETLVKVGDLVFHSDALISAENLVIEYLEKNKEISLAEARDLFNSSRKYMLPILEFLDRRKVTRRVEDKRVLFRVR